MVVVLDKNLDTVYWEMLDPVFSPDAASVNSWTFSRLIYFLISLMFFVAGAFMFYKLAGKALKDESERRVREQNLIYAAIAHDLKTPMTSVQGFAKAFCDGKIRQDEQQEIFDIIYRKSCSMNDMVNTLFDYAKFGTDGYRPDMAKADICTLVRDIAAENYTDLEEHGIEPEIDIPDEEIFINADKKELRRAVTNLVLNIYKHNPDGISAKISVYRSDDKAVIAIADSGNMLDMTMDIFAPFVTENSARTAGHGTGLGLAITKRIIERHSGEITAVDKYDGYTKAFVIKLPCIQNT